MIVYKQAWRINETNYQLRVFNKQFIGIDKDANNVVLATTTVPGESQTFQIVRNSDNPNRVKIKASNGLFLQVNHYLLVFYLYMFPILHLYLFFISASSV